jgi:glutamine---fructose-6-phosphate transaminase (isomerizing)
MFKTEKEMFESASIMKKFKIDSTKELAENIGSKSIIFTGMGSSVIFPGNNAKHRALSLNLDNRVEAFFASELLSYNNFANTHIFLCSNSGMTKETILLQKHLKKKGGLSTVITAVPDSFLAQNSRDNIILKCGFEEGVAATKSVIEQALVLDSLILNMAKIQKKEIDIYKVNKSLLPASKSVLSNIGARCNSKMTADIADASSLYFAGRVTGVADELALKAHEIARKYAVFYPDTHIVHGIEESIESNPIVLVEPNKFKEFLQDFKSFCVRTGSRLYGIGNKKSTLKGLRIKSTTYFENYCLLTGGWGLLKSIAQYSNIDIDNPKKAAKVGNPYKV